MRSVSVELDLLSSAALTWSSIVSSFLLGLEVAKHLLFTDDIKKVAGYPQPCRSHRYTTTG